MEILKFLLIVAIMAFAIVRQARKNKAATSEKSPAAPAPQTFDPMEKQKPRMKEEKTKLQRKSSNQTKKVPPMDPHSEGARATASPLTPPGPEQASHTDFAIGSAEDARKAIIWSEILNRKY